MGTARVTDREFADAVRASTSVADVFRKLGLSMSGGNYRFFKTRTARLGLDVSHMDGQSWAKGRTFPDRKFIPDEDVFKENSTYAGNLRERALRDGILKNQCVECGLGPEWQGKPLVLQLDHINGNPHDNRVCNLRIMCPNCHTQTATHSNKKRN